MHEFYLVTENDQVFELGRVHIYLKFRMALVPTITVIVYAEYDNVILIDSARTVLLDTKTKMYMDSIKQLCHSNQIIMELLYTYVFEMYR